MNDSASVVTQENALRLIPAERRLLRAQLAGFNTQLETAQRDVEFYVGGADGFRDENILPELLDRRTRLLPTFSRARPSLSVRYE